tara:strand:+ start:4093 stop:6114 length:2022 start_codon:yes stop_codon:yes gene_type:complete
LFYSGWSGETDEIGFIGRRWTDSGGDMAQASLALTGLEQSLQTVVVSRQKDFDQLFEGFKKMRAVSYVSSAEVLLDFLDTKGFDHIELLVGEGINSGQFKDDLRQKSAEVTERLAGELEAGRLRFLVSRRTIHSKFFILSDEERTRVIVTSANLTQTARRATNQTNYALYVDLAALDPLLERFEEDFQKHCKDSEVFMGDLIDLLDKRREIPREQVVSVWLESTGNGRRSDTEVYAAVENMVTQALSNREELEQPVVRLELPATPAARKDSQRLLKPLGADGKTSSVIVTPAKAVRFIEEQLGVPLLRCDVAKQELWLGFRGSISRVDAPDGPVDEMRGSLVDLESYIDMVELGQCPDPLFAKMSMFEALLYILGTPFANEQMRDRRSRLGSVNRRGPRYMYIYGPAQNGKTTFLRYSQMLITGTLIDGLRAESLKKRQIEAVQAFGTCYPLMFDDVTAVTGKTFEHIAKSHWESAWTETGIFPQLVFTSNSIRLPDWAKSRMKRIDFDVHFVPTTETQERLSRILEKPNQMFGWFARRYLERIRQRGWFGDDELETARAVMADLYAAAGRQKPAYFPTQPLETLYDPDLRLWKELVRQKKVAVSDEGDTTVIEFSDDLEPSELAEYRAALPQTIKYRRTGKTLIVENPEYLHSWLDSNSHGRPWWRRLLRRA